ncbi:MAG: agmatine deiminase family protein [bacterium]|nr:agmatine deiminase family protein [bacterium]
MARCAGGILSSLTSDQQRALSTTRSTPGPNRRLQFNYVPYPLWRRRLPLALRPFRPLINRALRQAYPIAEDQRPPKDAKQLARYLDRFGLLPGIESHTLDSTPVMLEKAAAATAATATTPVRIPAQWEPMEAVLLAWPILYPPLWSLHAQMAEALAPVAEVVICIPAATWAQGITAYLSTRGTLTGDLAVKVRYLMLPLDDMWIRDYGPIIGYTADGTRAAVDAIYDYLPMYPQKRDDAMPRHFAAHEGLPLIDLPLHFEGGNLWSDGAGTLLVSDQVFYANPYLERDGLEAALRRAFTFEKLIITPRLPLEETGHIDMLMKLANANTVLLSAPTEATSRGRLHTLRALFERETNAQGERYRLFELPTPPLVFNFWYPIRRSYTNALTVNGRVLVPVYGLPTDETALAVYAEAMPGYEIIPIDCQAGINGGGAVHCLTREIPR